MFIDCDFASIPTYADAVRHWETMKPWRGYTDEYNPRPLSNRTNMRRKKHVSIRKMPGDVFACKLFNTDCVTYYPNGDVQVMAGGMYGSVSTNQFVNTLLGRHVTAQFAGREPVLWVFSPERRGYRADDGCIMLTRDSCGGLTLSPDHKIVPFEWPTVNRSWAAVAVKEYHLKEFKDFLTARVHFGRPDHDDPYYGGQDMLRLLREGPPNFEHIYRTAMGVSSSVDAAIQRIRQVIYKKEGCLDTLTKSYVTSQNELSAIFGARNRY
ncbi:hypothetical protein [Silvimonas sp.]|uniref:hypothetical protein n=1 Tax=Silvimonas sp. TaxID=2650811 RepID=UPI0028486E16|nr:hypothetical protein [Silvimonas sp.]MDR3427774.1 hypothetical protein [Silvimonas sp.]